jgi:uncharacterized protein (DUF1697 family)
MPAGWFGPAPGMMSCVGTYVALLRGINLAGRNKLPMATLREVMTGLGHDRVRTYIQSGNVVFGSERDDTAALAAEAEQAIAAATGVQARVVVLEQEELARVAADNPYRDEPEPRLVHAIFLTDDPAPELAAAVDAAQQEAAGRGDRDEATVIGRTIFLHTPDGYGRSELAAWLARRSLPGGVAGTARNWATVTRLLGMCADCLVAGRPAWHSGGPRA